MKIVKYVFLLLLLAAIAICVFIATQEGKYDISAERVIKAPKNVLYNYIGEYKNWETAGIITDADTTANYSYSENTSGKGASMSWNNKNETGSISTVKLAENDSILQKATIEGLNSEIAWKFKDTTGGTKVSVRMKGELSFEEKAYALLRGHANEKLEKTLDNSLKNLNTFLVDELNNYKIEVKGTVTKTGMFYLGQAVTSKMTDVNKKANEIFPKLMSFVRTNKIVTTGAPFILYKTFDKQQETASYIISLPVKEEIYTAPGSEFEGGKLVAFQALKTTLRGDYSHLPKAWKAAEKHILGNALQENTTGQYVELYTKGMQQTKRPSEWVTDIYIPIGAPTTSPETAIEMLPTEIPSARPGTTTPKPTTNKPASSAAQKPAGTTTPVSSSRPDANKPAGTGTKPATTTAKPTGSKPSSSSTTRSATQSTAPVQPASNP